MAAIATFNTPTGVATIDMNGARATAWEYLYGSLRDRLSDSDWVAVYLQADGFGDCREGEAREWLIDYIAGGTDWSHVRDSSPEALSRVLAEIIRRQRA